MAIARVLGIKKSALSLDTTWDSSPVAYYSVIEVSVGIICACVITLRPLLTDMFPSLIKSSYGGHADAGYYTRDRNHHNATGGPMPGGGGGKKSSRETMMTHADHGIYGLADLEANQVLNGSQEGLTTSAAAFFEPAHFNSSPPPRETNKLPVNFSRMSTSITSGGKFPARTIGDPLSPVHKIRTRSGDIMITRETTIREETVVPASPVVEKDDHSSWLSESSTRETNNTPGSSG